MVNKWVEHVKRFSKEHGLSYGCALSMPECKSSYQSSKTPKATPRSEPRAEPRAEPPKDKAYSDLLTMVQQAKQMKPKGRVESMIESMEPMEGTVVKRKSKQMVQVPIYFIKSNFKKKADYTKAVKRAEKDSEDAMKYLSSFPDKSRQHFKQLIYNIITDFEEIHRIENELTEPDMSPSMITSRQARLKETERELADKIEELAFKGFVPKFL